MATVQYKKRIADYLSSLPADVPVTTDMVTAFIAGKTGEEEDRVRKAVNVNLARLEKDGIISRVTRGMYCRRINTPFGDYVPNRDILFGKRLVLDGDSVIGYETGLSLMNQLGLVSQMPKKREIVTNVYHMTIPKDVDIEVRKPRAPVTRDNAKYFQILDVIDGMGESPVDAEEPEQIIREKAKSSGLQPERLILYARRYYSAGTLKKTVDVLWGGIEL